MRPAVVLAACVLAASAAQARDLPGGAQLGMTVQQLQQVVPGLKPVPHPSRLAGGLVGSWSGAQVDVAGVPLTPTFFFAEAQLRRVEYLAAPGAGAAAFDGLQQWGRAQWGQELDSDSPEGRYATWSDDEMDVYLQQTERAQVRLVVKRRVLKDDTEL